MSDSSYVGDYFYANEESIKHRHELERQKGNPFVTGSMAGASFLQQPYGGLSHASLMAGRSRNRKKQTVVKT